MKYLLAILLVLSLIMVVGCESAPDAGDEDLPEGVDEETEEANGDAVEEAEPMMAAVEEPLTVDGSGDGFISGPFQAAGAEIYLAHDGEYLYVHMEAEVDGWMAVGFNAAGGGMNGANMILGYLDEGAPAYRDDVGQGHRHSEIGSPMVGEFYFSNNDGNTVMTFSYPLAFPDGEGYNLDRLTPGEAYTMIVALHNSSYNISGQHSTRGSIDFTVE